MNRRPRTTFALVLVLSLQLSIAKPIACCEWDRDTLAQEAKGLPDVIDVIVGRFERHPALYYEMRLERVTQEIQSSPQRLDLYDDAGVACDRLGRGQEAIAWMNRKKVELDKLPEDSEESRTHRYRYLANLGTFYAHVWIRSSPESRDPRTIVRARDTIAAAIELNPDAHFGREKFQLSALNWLVENTSGTTGSSTTDRESQAASTRDSIDGGIPRNLDSFLDDNVTGSDEEIEGLCGLIVLGAAWESIDVFYALSLSLQKRGDMSLAYLADCRIQELLSEGRKSFSRYAQDPSIDFSTLERYPNYDVTYSMGVEHLRPLERNYASARKLAKAYHDEHQEFMLAKLRDGRHPDTDPSFWDDYEVNTPSSDKAYTGILGSWKPMRVTLFLLLILPILGVFALAYSKRMSRVG